jgi:DNA-binding NarL/FixJ family response regulator
MIGIVLVDDQSLVCQGLTAMLSLEEDLEILGMANNGQAAIDLVVKKQPDVVLMDVRMPVMDGREATRLIVQQFPKVKVLVLSTFDDDQYIADSIKAGAMGYLLKDMPCEELAQAIRLVHSGYTQLGPGLMEKLIQGVAQPNTDQAESLATELNQLTKREREVFSLIGRGCTNREIADELYVTEGTVKTHVTHILNRLNLKNRSQIAIYANSMINGGLCNE